MSMTFYPGRSNHAGRWEFVCEGINVNDANAYAMLRALDLPASADGDLEPVPIDDFIGRCTSALRSFMRQPAPGRPWVQFPEVGAPRFVECGRDGAYMPQRISELSRLARQGREVGATHVYAG